MQDEGIQDEAKNDYAVLQLLITEDRLWSFDEIVRELGPRFVVEDAVGRLYGAGLVHRLESFVFATRAGVMAFRLF